MNTAENKAVSKLYISIEILVVLAILMILIKAVPPSAIFDSVWGRLYHPVRTVVMAGFIAALLARTHTRWAELGLRRPRSWLRAVGLGIGGFVVMIIVSQLVRHLLSAFGLPPAGNISRFSVVQGNLLEYLYWAGPVALFVGGFGEELIGRAYLISRLRLLVGGSDTLAWSIATVLAAVLFGLAHAYQGIGGIVQTGISGLILGALYLLGGRNLWPACIAHALSDFTGFTLIFIGAAKVVGA